MNDRITIINRTDKITPHIQILSSRTAPVVQKAHENIRIHLLKRHTQFEIELTMSEAQSYATSLNDLPMYLVSLACSYRKPFVYDDFDYLRRSIRMVSCRAISNSVQVKLCYDVGYLTTIFQEEQVDYLLRKLFFDKNAYAIKQPHQKIKFAYDYIVANVTYDRSFANISAYDALVKKRAVCEGCATLLYRMLSMFSIPCRIITGKGLQESHAWNIIAIDGRWYNADVTWDLYKNIVERRLSLYDYFLIGENQFGQHIRDNEFLTSEFMSKHPMASDSYM